MPRGAKPTAAKSAWKRWRSAVSEGEQAKQRPRKAPARWQGAAGEPGRRRQVSLAKSTAKGELAGQALGSDLRVQYGDRGWAGGQHRAHGEMSSLVVNGKGCKGCPPLLLMARVVGVVVRLRRSMTALRERAQPMVPSDGG